MWIVTLFGAEMRFVLFWSRVSSSILEIAVKLLRAVVQLRGQVVDAIQTFALLDSKTAQNYQFSVDKKQPNRDRAYLLEGVTVSFICSKTVFRPRQQISQIVEKRELLRSEQEK